MDPNGVLVMIGDGMEVVAEDGKVDLEAVYCYYVENKKIFKNGRYEVEFKLEEDKLMILAPDPLIHDKKISVGWLDGECGLHISFGAYNQEYNLLDSFDWLYTVRDLFQIICNVIVKELNYAIVNISKLHSNFEAVDCELRRYYWNKRGEQ